MWHPYGSSPCPVPFDFFSLLSAVSFCSQSEAGPFTLPLVLCSLFSFLFCRGSSVPRFDPLFFFFKTVDGFPPDTVPLVFDKAGSFSVPAIRWSAQV